MGFGLGVGVVFGFGLCNSDHNESLTDPEGCCLWKIVMCYSVIEFLSLHLVIV